MLETLTLVAALSCGQVLGPPQPMFGAPRSLPAAGERPATVAAQPQPTAAPARILPPALDGQPVLTPTARQAPAKVEEKKAVEAKTSPVEEKKEDTPETPATPPDPGKKGQDEEPAAEPAAPAGDRWILMKALQGTYPGYALMSNRMQIYGWTTGSYTITDSSTENTLPMTWNDRNEAFLLNQHWTRIERSVVTSGTTLPTFGWRVDLLAGTDYRWTLPRGLFNSQLENADGEINLYGVDPITHYFEWYFPTIFQGLDVKVGRFLTPFGFESVETVSSPLVSKSYMFNWFPPFTHYGILTTATINPLWTVQAGIVNGNDVMIGDPAEEYRFLGTIKYTHWNKRDVVTFGTSVGRGKMNTGEPYNPPTYGLMTEPAGRNNINVFDVVWNHVITSRVNYGLEVGYGYQTNVPANVLGGIVANDKTEGTAHWGGIVNYLTVVLNPHLTQITRFELFDDFEGQRTGFEGLYTALTFGLQYKPKPWLMIRPEVRWDHNDEGDPFSNGTRNNQFSAAVDLTVRW